MPAITDLIPLKWRRPLYTVGRFFRNLSTDYVAHDCSKSAAALTYLTLFALVPLMTVVYAVFSLIPAFDGVAEKLQSVLFVHFIPESGRELQSYLTEFSAHARSLTGVGVGMLVVTAYWMLTSIEKTFNNIWGVARPRKGFTSFLLYWAVLSIGPLLLGVGLAISTYVLSLKLVFNKWDTLGVSSVIFSVLPFCLTVIGFALLFAAVPNCRVPFRHALIGGFTTALAFQILKDVFSEVVVRSSIQIVYGAFAAVPLFLLWINLAWTVVLAGAILVRTLAERSYVVQENKLSDMFAALMCLELLRERCRSGRTVSDGDCYRMGIGVVHWQRLRTSLEKAHWLSQTANGRYVLIRDLRDLTLWDLASVLKISLQDLQAMPSKYALGNWREPYLQLSRELVDEAQRILGRSLEDLMVAAKSSEETQPQSDSEHPELLLPPGKP